MPRFQQQAAGRYHNRLQVQMCQYRVLRAAKLHVGQETVADDADPVFVPGDVLDDLNDGALEDVAGHPHGLDGGESGGGVAGLDADLPDGVEANRDEERVDAADVDALVGELDAQVVDVEVPGEILAQQIVEVLLGEGQFQSVQFH